MPERRRVKATGDLFHDHPGRPTLLTAARAELAGRDLACCAPSGSPCHADMLLEVHLRVAETDGT